MITARELVKKQIHHQATIPIPSVLHIESGLAAQLDEYYGSPAWRAGVPADIITVVAFDDSVYKNVDDTHSIDVFGTLWRTDLLPRHIEKPALERPSFAGYNFPAADMFFSDELFKKAEIKCRNHQDKFLVAKTGWGLFERTWTIRGFENALMDAITDQGFYEELLDRLLALQLEFVKHVLRLPVDGVMFSDDWGDQRGVILGPELWRKLIKPRVAVLYETVHAAGKYTLSHCCGNVTEIMPDIIEIGLDVIESVQPEAMDPFALKRQWGDKITFWGGLGSQSSLAFGTPEQIRRDIKQLCNTLGQGGGYILAPAKALMSGMPIANAAATVECFAEQRQL
ncbi:MAG TPA: hypothetical protein GXX29_05005 [Firmicutes bacterium]|nr:hypothetical protein [Bacillota bacterium]